MAVPKSAPLIARRYARLGVLGRGVTGTVHRAHDRLTGRLVALKSAASGGERTAEILAKEFKLLSSLRHPNVIASLDYGRDDEGRPFFTMDLEENARTILDAARDAETPEKVDLVVQLLHALVYLHRRGLVHGDLKPDNALASGGVVKLIDFGLAVATVQADQSGGGTLAYAAPEVLRGARPTERADLYALGVIAYEIFAGAHPFDPSSPERLFRSVLTSTPDLARLDARLAPVLGRLLAREPAARPTSAVEVLAALSDAQGRALPLETPSTRESLLQGAGLVGRDDELRRLLAALPSGERAGARAILVGGESGVGKSRLLDEVGVDAMIRGARVLRGQARREGSRPYEPWRGVLRLLGLVAQPTELEASVLEGVVSDIGATLGRDVPPAPELDPEATHVRLVRVVEALLRRAGEPLVLLVEDMQWAGAESLKLFARVQALASELPIALLATYRSDERPSLPRELPGAEVLPLGRLSPAAVGRLCASMIGEGDARGELVDLVWRESEGNAFLVLEVMRTLADEAGGLERVRALPLEPRTARIERLISRHVDRLPERDRTFLRAAAVAGRDLELDVLARAHPELDVEASAWRGVEAAVLASVQGRYWFSHDKLRDALIEELTDEERRRVHAKLAEATLAIAPTRASTLAYHFGAAGDAEREREFAALAGEQFLRSGAYHQATSYLRRALELSPTGGPLQQRASLERQLGEALFRSGQLAEARESLAAALATLKRPLPSSRPRRILALLSQACVQLGLRARQVTRAPPRADVARFEEAILAYTQLSRLAHHLNDEELVLLVTVSALNLSERAKLVAHHARLAAVMGAVMGLLPVHRWARFYFEEAETLSAALDDPSVQAFVLAHRGYYEAGIGDFRACEDALERSREIYDRIGDVRLAEESVSILAYALFFRGELKRSLSLYRSLERSGEERSDTQIVSWGLTNRLKLLVRSGRIEDADDLLARVDALLVDGITKTVRDGVRVELELARGDLDAAETEALAASDRLRRSAPRSFMAVSTYALIAEALLTCWRAAQARHDDEGARRLRRLAAQANRDLARIARVFPIAEPARLLHAGTFEALRGRRDRARALWGEAARVAAKAELPFEEALAVAALAMCPEVTDRHEKRERARALFDRLGASRHGVLPVIL